MERKEELLKLLNDSNSTIIEPLIEKILFLERQLEYLETLPMIRVNPNNPEQQKTTSASKLYKEFLQQYINVIKVVSREIGNNNDDEISPLRAWANARNIEC